MHQKGERLYFVGVGVVYRRQIQEEGKEQHFVYQAHEDDHHQVHECRKEMEDVGENDVDDDADGSVAGQTSLEQTRKDLQTGLHRDLVDSFSVVDFVGFACFGCFACSFCSCSFLSLFQDQKKRSFQVL
jgi:hypothetical protein